MRTTVIYFVLALLLVLSGPLGLSAQGAPGSTVPEKDVTYIMPFSYGFQTATDDELKAAAADLRGQLGEGRYVRVGFAVSISVSMTRWDVDPTDSAAVRQALAGAIATIDAAIARARTAGIPICLSVLTPARESYDPAQTASEREDRRNMQWYSDNSLASGWWTHSRYARKQARLQEAYVRELGRVLANRMARYPETVVAAAGDGEIEVANPLQGLDPLLADYSPFTVAEFRDWLRRGGLYGQGQPFAGEGYEPGSRYQHDPSPAEDSVPGDGHTLNGDFGTTFTTWDLRYFNWNLADDIDADPHAIPLATYSDPGPNGSVGGFDAPRERTRTDAWGQVWRVFRETMVGRHTQRFAKWMTTTVDEETGARVPTGRWYSYQIPADSLFGLTRQNPHPRLETSASTVASADTSPYGSLGVTSFNIVYPDGKGGAIPVRTLFSTGPRIAERNVRFGLIEWHPCLEADPAVPDAAVLDVCRAEMDLVVQYRPSLLIPYSWDHPAFAFKDTAFETELRKLVKRLNGGYSSDARVKIDGPSDGASVTAPFTVSGWSLDFGNRGPGRTTGVNAVHIYAYPEGPPRAPVFLGEAEYGIARPDVGTFLGAQYTPSGFRLSVSALPAGRYRLVAFARTTVTEAFSVAESVGVTVVGPQPRPVMMLDGPQSNSTVGRTVTVAGWAVDLATSSGTGVDTVHVWAYPNDGSAARFVGVATYGLARRDIGAVLGSQFTSSGYRLSAVISPPGAYSIVAFAYSTVAGTFNAAVVASNVTVQDTNSNAVLFVDAPGQNATAVGPLTVSGWAVDIGADAGTGISEVHVWAFPTSGAAATFVGVASYGTPRPDIGSLFGNARFNDSGFTFRVNDTNLTPGTYDLIVFGRSTVTQAFTVARVVRVTLQ